MIDEDDDITILDEDPLWRRIHPAQVVADATGGLRLSSGAFANSSDGTGMSVTLAREARESGVSERHVIAKYPGKGLAELPVVACRTLEQRLSRDATAEDPHHALVVGDKPPRVRRALAAAAKVLIFPGSTN